jgi:hypothetical protein
VTAATVLQIPVVLGHERAREAVQMKKDDDRIRFHTLLTVGMHRGGRISREKGAAAVCSSVLGGCAGSCSGRHWPGARVRRGGTRGERGCRAGRAEEHGSQEQGRRCWAGLASGRQDLGPAAVLQMARGLGRRPFCSCAARACGSTGVVGRGDALVVQERATRRPAGGGGAAAGDAQRGDNTPGGRRQHLFMDV